MLVQFGEVIMTRPLPKHLEPHKFTSDGEPNLHRIALRVPTSLKERLDQYKSEHGVGATNDRIRQILAENF